MEILLGKAKLIVLLEGLEGASLLRVLKANNFQRQVAHIAKQQEKVLNTGATWFTEPGVRVDRAAMKCGFNTPANPRVTSWTLNQVLILQALNNLEHITTRVPHHSASVAQFLCLSGRGFYLLCEWPNVGRECMLLEMGHVWAGQCVSLHHSPNRPLFATEKKREGVRALPLRCVLVPYRVLLLTAT